ncbi:MAG TPA: hypothetical protein VGM25_14795 [Caulobacteraceae bacterium]|jgi:hypothetical protein
MTSKTRAFVLPIVSATATAFLAWGCSRDHPRQICVGAADVRVDDANCGRSDPRYHWYYYPSGGGGVAGIGSRAYGGTTSRLGGATFFSAPAGGIARGGFGGIGGGGEGGGGE